MKIGPILVLSAAAMSCSPSEPQREARSSPVEIRVGVEPARLDLPRAGVREVLAEVRVAAPAPDHALMLIFYAEDRSAPIATPTLYPPDKPADFLVQVPAGVRWLRVEVKSVASCGGEKKAEAPPPVRLIISLRTRD